MRTVRGAAWTIGTSVFARATGVAGTLVLTRFLAPSDYGAVSVAVTLAATVNVLSSFGFGQYIASRPTHDPRAAFHATVLHVGVGALSLFALRMFATPLALFLHTAGAAAYVGPLCLAFCLERVAYVPERVLIQRMRFREISLARSSSSLCYTAAALAFARAGMGGSAIAWGNVIRFGIKALVVLWCAERKDWLAPAPPDRATISRLFRFGLPLSLAGFLLYVTANWDNLLVARWFGPATLGAYTLAYSLADTPANQIAEQAGDVLVPAYAQQGPEARRRAFVRSLAFLALLITPLAVGLGAIAPTLVGALLDRRWAAAAPMLLILSMLSVARPAVWITNSYLMAIDRPRRAALVEIAKIVLLFGCLGTLGRHSPTWACAAVGIGFTAACAVALKVVSDTDHIAFGALARAQIAPLLPASLMVLSILLVRALSNFFGFSLLARLFAEASVGAGAYVAGAFAFCPTLTRDLLSGASRAFRERSASHQLETAGP